jgi:hypothetical protein
VSAIPVTITVPANSEQGDWMAEVTVADNTAPQLLDIAYTDPVDASAADATLTVTMHITVPQGTEAGTWALDTLTLTDQLGNTRSLYVGNLVDLSLPPRSRCSDLGPSVRLDRARGVIGAGCQRSASARPVMRCAGVANDCSSDVMLPTTWRVRRARVAPV